MIGYHLEGGGSFEIGRPRSRRWKNFESRWTRGVGVLKIEQFSWTSYVYHLLAFAWFLANSSLSLLIKVLHIKKACAVFLEYCCFISCVIVLVGRFFWLVFRLSGIFHLPPSGRKCLVSAFYLWRIRDVAFIMMHLLAYTCMILISAKIHVHMTVSFIWVTLIPLVGGEGISRSYWVTVLPLLIGLI